MKKICFILSGIFFCSLINAQVVADRTGFKMEFNFEDGPAPEIVSYEGVVVSYNLDTIADGDFNIINGILEWYVKYLSTFTLD